MLQMEASFDQIGMHRMSNRNSKILLLQLYTLTIIRRLPSIPKVCFGHVILFDLFFLVKLVKMVGHWFEQWFEFMLNGRMKCLLLKISLVLVSC